MNKLCLDFTDCVMKFQDILPLYLDFKGCCGVILEILFLADLLQLTVEFLVLPLFM